LYFLSDSYPGIDQQLNLAFEVKGGVAKDKLASLGNAKIKTSDTDSVVSTDEKSSAFFDSVDDE